jgi:adenosylhomocysteine nucleosidase
MRNLVNGWLREQAQERLLRTWQELRRQHTDPDQPPPDCDVVVLFARRAEAGGLVDQLSQTVTTRGDHFVEHLGRLGERFLAVIETGVGSEMAARAAQDAVALHRPRWLISSGFATGLQPDVKRGHMVIAREVADPEGQSLAIDLQLDPQAIAASRGWHTGKLITLPSPIDCPADKREAGQAHQAVACDLDSMAVAQVCLATGTTFLSVRAVEWSVDDDVAPLRKKLQSQPTLAARLGAATGAVFHKPSTVKDMWQVKEDALRISDRLARFLIGLIEQLRAE